MNLNKVILVGRLTKDPEIRSLSTGQEVVTFSLATDRYFIDKENVKKRETEFHNIVLFGKLAKIASLYLKKGSLTLIEGRLRTRSWKNSDGKTVSKTEIIGEKLQLGPKSFEQTEEKGEIEEEIPIIEEASEEIDLEDIPF